MINNFFTRLNSREKLIFYGASLIISILLFDRLILSPIMQKIKFYNNEIDKQESVIKKNLRILDQKEKIKNEEGKYTNYFPGENKLSKEEEVSLFLKMIENMAKDYSLKIIDLKPVDTEAAASSGEYLINLECEAKIEDFINFVYNIEYSKDILRIRKFDIVPLSVDSNIAKFSITVSKIIIP